MITIKTIQHKELLQYIASEEYLNSDNIPISPIRAQAQAHNPTALAEDIVLIIAYQGETLVGYLGIVPDDIFDKEGNFAHIGWFSCIWTDKNMRGKGIAKQLILEAYKLWHGQVILAQFTPEAEIMYKKMNIFADMPIWPNGLRLYLKSDINNILIAKKTNLKALSPFLKIIDFCANLLLKPFSNAAIFPLEYKAEYLTKITYNDLPNNPEKYLVPTNLSTLNWIIKYPWIRKDKEKTVLEKKYYFTSADDSFGNDFIKLKNTEDEVIATFMLLKRRHILKIPYLYALNKDAALKVIHYIVEYMKSNNISTFVCYQPMLVQILQQVPMGFIYKKEKTNPYLVGKDLLEKLPDLSKFILQDGNGDAAFT